MIWCNFFSSLLTGTSGYVSVMLELQHDRLVFWFVDQRPLYQSKYQVITLPHQRGKQINLKIGEKFWDFKISKLGKKIHAVSQPNLVWSLLRIIFSKNVGHRARVVFLQKRWLLDNLKRKPWHVSIKISSITLSVLYLSRLTSNGPIASICSRTDSRTSHVIKRHILDRYVFTENIHFQNRFHQISFT